MSEKDSCPRCDSYVSEVYYDRRHTFCGWNCIVQWEVSAYGPSGSAEVTFDVKPTPEQRDTIAALVQAETRVQVVVDGSRPEGPLSPWLDPNKPSPPDLSREGKRRIARREKKARLLADAERRIEDELGDDE